MGEQPDPYVVGKIAASLEARATAAEDEAGRWRSLAVELAEALEDARAALSVGSTFQRVPRATEVVVAALSKAKEAGLLGGE